MPTKSIRNLVPEKETWYGNVNNDCGPADGLAVDSASVTADVRVESNANGKTSIRAGKAVFAKCRTRPICG